MIGTTLVIFKGLAASLEINSGLQSRFSVFWRQTVTDSEESYAILDKSVLSCTNLNECGRNP